MKSKKKPLRPLSPRELEHVHGGVPALGPRPIPVPEDGPGPVPEG